MTGGNSKGQQAGFPGPNSMTKKFEIETHAGTYEIRPGMARKEMGKILGSLNSPKNQAFLNFRILSFPNRQKTDIIRMSYRSRMTITIVSVL
jgi:hypothetical protein